MGLDQFMNCVSGDGKEYYWRKHARLQQFMSQKWAEQNPNKEPDSSFNLGFNGGECKSLAHFPIHFPIDDMQVSEDLQMIVGHMCMQWLCDN